jgi:isoleucyl-tRNA synthetase
LKDDEVFDRVIKAVGEEGADVWFGKPADFFISGKKCAKCGGGSFTKETDILDVWFDSGVSHAAVLDSRAAWPADMYLEGSDQHRGWFQSSLLESVGTRGIAPYRSVLTHGFVVDGQGKKMSKSLGNVVAPQDIIKANGAEILRLWVSAEDYTGDVRISKEIVARLSEAYRKVRNTARYLLGNTHDFTPAHDFTPLAGVGNEGGAARSGPWPVEIDRWAMSRLQGLIGKVTEAYESFAFHEVYQSVYNFCVVDMSSFYLDILKDRLYTFKKDSPERRAAQRVLGEVLVSMTKLIAPVLSFTAEEIWRSIKGRATESVFLSQFPEVDENIIDKTLEARWKTLIEVREIANKALELKRAEKFIGSSLEAKVTVYLPEEVFSLVRGYEDFLPALFIVSQAGVKGGAPETADAHRGEVGIYDESSYAPPGFTRPYQGESHTVYVVVEKAEGAKCQRCWNYSASVGTFADLPEICDRCYNHIK